MRSQQWTFLRGKNDLFMRTHYKFSSHGNASYKLNNNNNKNKNTIFTRKNGPFMRTYYKFSSNEDKVTN